MAWPKNRPSATQAAKTAQGSHMESKGPIMSPQGIHQKRPKHPQRLRKPPRRTLQEAHKCPTRRPQEGFQRNSTKIPQGTFKNRKRGPKEVWSKGHGQCHSCSPPVGQESSSVPSRKPCNTCVGPLSRGVSGFHSRHFVGDCLCKPSAGSHFGGRRGRRFLYVPVLLLSLFYLR